VFGSLYNNIILTNEQILNNFIAREKARANMACTSGRCIR